MRIKIKVCPIKIITNLPFPRVMMPMGLDREMDDLSKEIGDLGGYHPGLAKLIEMIF